ncbi:MAG: hypothetical protein ACFB21_06665 [Opitutales bacterium]
MKTTRNLIVAASLLAATSAFGAFGVSGLGLGVSGVNPAGGTATYSFAASKATDNYLLVGIAGEDADVTAVTFGGVALSLTEARALPDPDSDEQRFTAIWGLDLSGVPAGPGTDIEVTTNDLGSGEFVISALEITGTSSAPFTLISGSSVTTPLGAANTADIEPFGSLLPPGGIYFDVVASGRDSAATPPVTADGEVRDDSVLTDIPIGDAVTGTSYIAGYAGGSAPGWADVNGGASMSAVVVSPIPEPGVYLAGITAIGLGASLLLRRKRNSGETEALSA